MMVKHARFALLPMLLLILSATGLRAEEDEWGDVEEFEEFDAVEIVTLEEAAPEPTLLERIGRFHVPLVHFPIAWLTLAALFALARLRWERLGDVDLLLIGLALLSAIPALITGLIHEESREGNAAIHEIMENHETLAFVTIGLAAATFIVRLIAWRKSNRTLQVIAALLAGLAVVAVGLTGHLGGTMVFGEGFLFGG